MLDEPIKYELIKDACALIDLKAIDTQVEKFMENTRVRITMQESPEILERAALRRASSARASAGASAPSRTASRDDGGNR